MKTKKAIIGAGIIIILIVAVLLVVKKRNESGQSAKESLGNSTYETDSQSYWNPDEHNFARGEDGYYYQGKMGRYLMYLDEKTKKSTPVCTKADCNHDNPECNAYLGGENYLLNRVYYYDGNIYVLKYEGGMSILTQIKSDGTGRKDIVKLLPSSGGSSVSLVFHGNYVYVYDCVGHSGSTKEQDEIIKKISLDGKTEETVFTYTNVGAAILKGRSFGNKLYFLIREYGLDRNTAQQTVKFDGLYTYDYDTNETKKIMDQEVEDYYVNTKDNILYYFVLGEGLYKSNLGSKEKELLYAANEKMISCNLSFDGTYLYLDNSGVGSTTDPRALVDKQCIVLDLDGKLINTIPYKNELYFGDSKMMFQDVNMHTFGYIEKDKIQSSGDWNLFGD